MSGNVSKWQRRYHKYPKINFHSYLDKSQHLKFTTKKKFKLNALIVLKIHT